ncbi:CopG family transcriptional regulator [Actinosynnema sp. ALI-1.44]|uniref:CopG family transcriptional regulator n=2 Tax=Pseudonocardiales TaxID=85010 RepID=A0A0N9I4D2_9PSEU|nr:CopG family transcriptional regulator [Kibdelosporangium phytohabitans]MBE1465580.1 putative transcriptional regulator [Kibdelosporangium phytohabitans]ONI85860.1 CopG family transcriptional regulator [Actinosynnema sp. ALI-1.44]
MAMTLRLSDEESEQLEALAEAEGRSSEEILRLALSERWSKLHKQQQIGDVLERILPRYQGLLERLGTG